MRAGVAGKFGLPALLAAINVALLGGWLGYLAPMTEDLTLQKRSMQNATAGLRNRLASRAEELERVAQSRSRYDDLVARGFVSPQDRLGAAKLLEELRETQGLSSIHYEIAPEMLVADRALGNTGFRIVSTKVRVGMQAMFDANIIDFTQAVVERFPGQVRLISLTLQELARPTETTLDALRNGEAIDFATGELVFEWNTLRPIETYEQGQGS